MRLQGKVAVVTGAGSGFGEGIAKRFAQEGAKVVVNDIDKASGERVAREIVAAGGRALFSPGDVGSDGDVATVGHRHRGGLLRLGRSGVHHGCVPGGRRGAVRLILTGNCHAAVRTSSADMREVG